MSRPNEEQTSTGRGACLRILLDHDFHNGLELRENGGGHHYSARLDELRALGYEIERRSTEQGEFDDYRLIRLGDPAMSTTVNLKLSYSLLEGFFAKKIEFRDELKHLLVGARERAQAKHKKAVAYQQGMADAEEGLMDFFASFPSSTKDDEDE
jgi:hypothetical protein